MQSRSRAPRAADGSLSYEGMRYALATLAAERNHWAGLPMPITGERLIIEPTFPGAAGLMSIGQAESAAASGEGNDGWRERNRWYSSRRQCDVVLMEKGGRIDWGLLPAVHHFDYDLSTLGCVHAWGIEQETRALELLAGMISEHQMRCYLLTGMFVESSRRSGVAYVFRRLRPTIALAAHPGLPAGKARILCALCMHPIGYYARTWAGAMVPTDDVIAHLALMRGDEPMFWRRANQHPAWRPEAGL